MSKKPGSEHIGCDCTRCGCEFSALLSIRAASRQFCVQAIEKIRDEQDFEEALRLSEVAWRLNREVAASQVGLLAAVQQGAINEIPKWLKRIRSL